jgi:1-acyl-sn-glycerol-3-phosphate acyltransferase
VAPEGEGGPRRKKGIAVESLYFVNGSYRTGEKRRSGLAWISPGLVFYSRLLSIVFRAGSKAKRGRYDDDEWQQSSLNSVRALEEAGVRFEISGMENVANLEGPCVFIGNHMSTLETFVLPVVLLPFKRVTFVVKQSLVEYPVFGHVMRSRDPITVGRTNPRDDLKAVLEGGVERLGKGMSVIIFPQTTRTAQFDPGEFNSIGIKLAKRADVPVVPLALKTDAWGNGKLIKEFGRIDPSRPAHLLFGAPLRIRGRGGEEHEEIVRFITSKLKEWGGSVKEPGATT